MFFKTSTTASETVCRQLPGGSRVGLALDPRARKADACLAPGELVCHFVEFGVLPRICVDDQQMLDSHLGMIRTWICLGARDISAVAVSIAAASSSLGSPVRRQPKVVLLEEVEAFADRFGVGFGFGLGVEASDVGCVVAGVVAVDVEVC